MDAIDVLREHNQWRRGEINVMPHFPREVGEAIDAACARIAQLEAELAAARKVPDEGKLWSFLLDVLEDGVKLARYYGNGEHYFAHRDGKAAERAQQLSAMLAAAPQEPKP